jgi:6-phosphogluconolactonase (cycloisomerase 2 family)
MWKRFVRWTLAVAASSAGLWLAASAQARSFVYTNANIDGPNAIETFERNEQTGRLTYVRRTFTGGVGDPFTGGFEQHAVVTNGRFLYAVNPGPRSGDPSMSGTVSSFRIHNDGTLELLNVVSTRGRRPVALALNRNLLYVANQGSIPGSGEGLRGGYSGFIIRGNGSLEANPRFTFATPADSSPADILFQADGRRLVGMQLVGNQIDSFQVAPNAVLSNHQTIAAGGGPFGAAFSPRRTNLLYVTLAVPEVFGPPAPGIGSYRMDADSTLNLIANKTVEDTRDPCWIVFYKDGEHYWVNTFIPRTLFLFGTDKTGRSTELSRLVGRDDPNVPDDDTQPGGKVIIGATDIALSPDSKFLYGLRAFSTPDGAIAVRPRIHIFRVTEDWDTNAGLSFVQEAFLPNDLSEAGVMGLVVVDN